MLALAAALVHLAVLIEDALEGPRRAQIAALVEQGGVDGKGRGIFSSPCLRVSHSYMHPPVEIGSQKPVSRKWRKTADFDSLGRPPVSTTSILLPPTGEKHQQEFKTSRMAADAYTD
jgi:hypothetical protein